MLTQQEIRHHLDAQAAGTHLQPLATQPHLQQNSVVASPPAKPRTGSFVQIIHDVMREVFHSHDVETGARQTSSAGLERHSVSATERGSFEQGVLLR